MGSMSWERFWKILFNRALEAGEKCWRKDLEGDVGGVTISGSDIVIKEESLEVLSAFELGSEQWRKHWMSWSLLQISIWEFKAMW